MASAGQVAVAATIEEAVVEVVEYPIVLAVVEKVTPPTSAPAKL